MYSSLMYIETHHSYAAIPGQPSQDPTNKDNIKDAERDGAAADAAATTTAAQSVPQPNGPAPSTAPATLHPTAAAPPPPEPASGAPAPHPPARFAATLRELAQDHVLKEQQIELLVGVLPGIGTSEREQVDRMARLEGELRAVEGERREAVRERERLVRRVEGVLGACRGL